ncbi:M81 family metallopeptidase [Paenochrobactrum sp. BZR 588]|uniref:M81 family metallopeptidase n=1 Tax=unclassified Paenochrobactrum TaxID=2639760 RepID=UPI003854C1E0
MRILIARLNHETNSFSPVVTNLQSFNPHYGDDAAKFADGSNTALGAFYAYALGKNAEIIVPLAATANPSGPVEDEAFERLAAAITDGVTKGCDLILLDLHGAMVTRSFDDGEGELLRRVRAIAPTTPIGVALDLHGNITQDILDNCDCIVGFKTYPHIDMYATGKHVTRIIDKIFDDGLQPKQAFNHPPMLAATLRMNTNEDCAMTDIINLAKEIEKREGIHAVSVFGGFPIADLKETGLSIVVVADSDALAKNVAAEVAQVAWQRRDDFLYTETPLEISVSEAKAERQKHNKGYVLMLDHGDNCMSGGTCDNMDVLQTSIQAGLKNIIAGPFSDPEVVEQLFAAGVGAEVTIELGNKIVADDFVAPQPPLKLTGTVTALSDGDYVVSGPIYTGQLCHMGRAVAFKTNAAIILITEMPHEPWDLGVFNCANIDPLQCDYLILKSRMYCRPVFEPQALAVVECASGGVTSSNYQLFSFKKLARPIYPLDNESVWQ